MKLPSPETANNINEYYENIKQDEKYKDIKILITDMQKETIEFEKAEILLEQEIFNKSNPIFQEPNMELLSARVVTEKIKNESDSKEKLGEYILTDRNFNEKRNLEIEQKNEFISFNEVTIKNSKEIFKDERSTVNMLEVDNHGKKFEVKETLVDNKVAKVEFARSVKEISHDKLGEFNKKEKTRFQKFVSKVKSKSSKGIDR